MQQEEYLGENEEILVIKQAWNKQVSLLSKFGIGLLENLLELNFISADSEFTQPDLFVTLAFMLQKV